MMGQMALWLSKQERVEVETVMKDEKGRYKDSLFQVRRQDGSAVCIDRRDILMPDEEAMIDELASILHRIQHPAKHARYASIMRHLLLSGVPYVSMLKKRMPPKPMQQQLQLEVG